MPRSCERLCTQPASQPASTDGPQKPRPPRCFLEKGSCGQKWLFPVGSCMLELTQGSEKACGEGLYLFVRLIEEPCCWGTSFGGVGGVPWVPKATPYLLMSFLIPHGPSAVFTFSARCPLFSFPRGLESLWESYRLNSDFSGTQ